jgi:hypothetical protein
VHSDHGERLRGVLTAIADEPFFDVAIRAELINRARELCDELLRLREIALRELNAHTLRVVGAASPSQGTAERGKALFGAIASALAEQIEHTKLEDLPDLAAGAGREDSTRRRGSGATLMAAPTTDRPGVMRELGRAHPSRMTQVLLASCGRDQTGHR